MEWQRKSEKRYAATNLAAENRVRFPLSAPKTKDRRKFKKGLRRSRFHRFGVTFREIVTFFSIS